MMCNPSHPFHPPHSPSPDQLDEIQAASERTLAVSKLDREFNQLRIARAAIRRIQEGSFGTCQECEEDIHPKRLAAVPWTPFCIRCQEALDRNPDGMETPIYDFPPAPSEDRRRNTILRKAA